MLASQDEAVVHVDRVTSDERANDASHALSSTDVPNLDVLVPASGDDKVGVLTDELGAEDTVSMARQTAATTFQCFRQLSSLFIVDTDLAIFTSSQKLLSVLLIVCRQ